MSSPDQPTTQETTARKILKRFAHLLSAQGIDGVMSAFLVFYLAWTNRAIYGELMYALAVAGITLKTVQYGVYYPLVNYLAEADRSENIPEILNMANAVKLIFTVVSMVGVWGFCLYRGFSSSTVWVVCLLSLGCALEVIAETYFADLRIKGLQKSEARTRVIGSILSYGYALIAAAIGAHPVVIAMYRIISGLLRLGLGVWPLVRVYGSRLLAKPEWSAVWVILRASTVFALYDIVSTLYNKSNILFLERYTGMEHGVALYSAVYNLIDPVSILVSEQLLAWVIFPLLASMWWNNREEIPAVVRRTAQWLMIIALPVMFVMYAEREFLIGLVYPREYGEGAYLLKYLVWAILFSFESNLFNYLMMVAGGIRALLGFAGIVMVLNLLFNWALVAPYGLAGGCLVIVLTKMSMTILSLSYCQWTLGIFRATDIVFPVILTGVAWLFFVLVEPVVTLHPAVVLTVGLYGLLVWKPGTRYLGNIPWKKKD
jgi:O-antigen/teichoic acid export membrane protein